MDHKLAKFQGSAMLSTRAVALFALVIAGVLGSWRASDLLNLNDGICFCFAEAPRPQGIRNMRLCFC